MRLGVLGPLLVEVGGRTVDPGSPKQRSVLARLAAEGGRVVSTDRFVEDLWNGEPPPKALGALQVYISNLRRVLEPDRAPRTPATVLVSVPPGYALQREQGDDGRVDSWRFEDLVSRAATATPQRALDLLDEALGLWRGPAFPEFRDESWAGPVADRLEELRCTALESRAQAALALGKHSQVAVDLDRHVAEHPMRENAVRLQALALYRTGRQAHALAVLSRTRRLLADELGLDPGPALQSLETAILNQDRTLDAPTGTAETAERASPLPRQTPPRRHLLGRDAEFTAILEGARRAREHGLQLVWLGGEPGAGKSALADAVSTRLAADGWTVCLGRCPEVEGAPPAWAWSEALRALTARHPADPALAERLAPLLTEDTREPSSQFWVARAVAEYLSGFAPVPLLMVLDDVHRADGETLRLLRRVATDLAQAPVLVLASHRPAETTADLGSTWAALTGPASEHLDLTGLDEADVARLLGRYLDDVDDELARQVTERTGGNPLFVCETARLVASEGRGVAMHGIPAGVRDVLRRRIGRLPGPSQDVLRTAAIIGRDVEVDVLLATLDDHEDEVLDALEFGVLTGLLTEPAPGQVRFTHALVRDTLYEDTPRLRRTRLHGQVLDAVARTRPADVTALAHHALAGATANTAHRAAGFAADAARHASSMAGFREAAQLWEGALSALELAVGSDDAARLDAYCGLASAQAHAGNVLAGRAARAAAVSLATKLGDRPALIRALCCYDSEITWSIRPDLQLDHGLVAVLDTVLRDEHDPSDRCKLLCSLTFEVESYDNDRADVTSAAALELARGIPDAALRCRALNARYFVALHPTRRDELEALGRELLDVATGAGLVGYQVLAHHVLYMLALGACKLEDARWHADFAVQRATTGQLGDTLDKLELFDALEDLVTGNYERAEERYLRHTQKMHESGAANAEAVGALGRAVVRLTAGRGGELVDELRPFYERMPVQALELFVRVLIAAGRVEEARAMWAPDLVVTMDYFYLLWRAIRAENAIHLQDGPVARRCYDELAPHAGQFAGMGGGSVTVGPVDLYLGDLAAFLGDCAGARSHYTAAGALATTVGSPHWAARADASLAALP